MEVKESNVVAITSAAIPIIKSTITVTISSKCFIISTKLNDWNEGGVERVGARW